MSTELALDPNLVALLQATAANGFHGNDACETFTQLTDLPDAEFQKVLDLYPHIVEVLEQIYPHINENLDQLYHHIVEARLLPRGPDPSAVAPLRPEPPGPPEGIPEPSASLDADSDLEDARLENVAMEAVGALIEMMTDGSLNELTSDTDKAFIRRLCQELAAVIDVSDSGSEDSPDQAQPLRRQLAASPGLNLEALRVPLDRAEVRLLQFVANPPVSSDAAAALLAEIEAGVSAVRRVAESRPAH